MRRSAAYGWAELLALRWRHVVWHAQRLHIQRACALGQEDSPKGRRGRTVPLADQPARALAQLSQRSVFTRNADLVFCSRAGEHLDGSALRRRFKAARDAAVAESPDMPVLRFHEYADVVVMPISRRNALQAAEDATKLTRILAQDSSSVIVDAVPAST